MNWFTKNGIKLGNPEDILERYEDSQKELVLRRQKTDFLELKTSKLLSRRRLGSY